MFRMIRSFVYEKTTDISILKVMIKNLCNLSNGKTQYLFILNYKSVVGEVWVEKGRKGSKKLCNLSNERTQYLFILNYKRCCGRCVGGEGMKGV